MEWISSRLSDCRLHNEEGRDEEREFPERQSPVTEDMAPREAGILEVNLLLHKLRFRSRISVLPMHVGIELSSLFKWMSNVSRAVNSHIFEGKEDDNKLE